MSSVDRTYCCNLSAEEDTTNENDTKSSSSKREVRKKRNWGWNKKRPDTPMINKISTIKWNRSRSSNSECTDSSCPNSANTLSVTDSKDEMLLNSAANLQKFDLDEDQLRILSISEENNKNGKRDELIVKNSCKRTCTDEKKNNEEPNNSSSNSSSHLVLNSRGIFLKPLITSFPNKVSRNFTESKDVENAFE